MSGVIDSMMNFIYTGPAVPVYLFLLCVVFFRAQGTYWLGRYMGNFIMTRGKPDSGWRLRAYNWIHADSTSRAIDTLQRRGWPVIPVSFLTVGFQTMVNMGAGVIRMTWPRYTAAMFPGCLAWAFIYSTIGWTVWKAALSAAAGSPLGLLATAIIILAAIWWFKRSKKAGADIVETEEVESNQ